MGCTISCNYSPLLLVSPNNSKMWVQRKDSCGTLLDFCSYPHDFIFHFFSSSSSCITMCIGREYDRSPPWLASSHSQQLSYSFALLLFKPPSQFSVSHHISQLVLLLVFHKEGGKRESFFWPD